MKLKKLYSSREVAAMTGLSAKQLQWWDRRRVFTPTVPSHKTDAGGFTERRYTSIELLELVVLADLRRRGFSVARLRRLMAVLQAQFKVRLFEAIEGGGPVTLYIDPSTGSGSPRAKSRGDGGCIYARTEAGDLFNVLDQPEQPLLMVGEQIKLRELTARERRAPRKARKASA
jgi:DNA-binding transcriptional MerR regulator